MKKNYILILTILFLMNASVVNAAHDAHRNAVRYIARGQYDLAEQQLNHLLEVPGDVWPVNRSKAERILYVRAADFIEQEGETFSRFVTPETHFCLALLESERGNSLKALGTIIKGDWKLIEFQETLYGQKQSFELYHLKEDPTEQNNLANKMPKKVEKLKRAMYAWRKSVDAPVQSLDMYRKTVNPQM